MHPLAIIKLTLKFGQLGIFNCLKMLKIVVPGFIEIINFVAFLGFHQGRRPAEVITEGTADSPILPGE